MEFEPDATLGGEIGPGNNTWDRDKAGVTMSNGKNYRSLTAADIKPLSDDELKTKKRELSKTFNRKTDLPCNFVKTENGRWALDLGGDNCYEIYTLPEMKKLFTRQYRTHNGEVYEPTAGMVARASENGFFKKWIVYNMYFKDEDGDPKVRNLGDAIEYIFGKKKDNKPGADISGAELKAYNGVKTDYVELFALSPYEMKHYESDIDTTGEFLDGKNFGSATDKIKSKIESAVKAKAQTKMIYTTKTTDYMANSRSYASVRIIPGENGSDSTAKDFVINTQFYIPGEKRGEEVPIDRIESVYSIEATQEVLYTGTKGEDKQNFHNTIKNKIQTMFHFSTVKIETEIEKGFKVVDNAKSSNKVFFAYNSLTIHKVRNIQDLLCNFIDAINMGYMQIHFGIGDNLTLSAHFKIKNSEEAWSYLYRDRNNEAMVEADPPGMSKKVKAGVKYKEEDLSNRFQNAQFSNEYLNNLYDNSYGQNVARDIKLIDNTLDRRKRNAKKEAEKAQKEIEKAAKKAEREPARAAKVSSGRGRKKKTETPTPQDQVEGDYNDGVGL